MTASRAEGQLGWLDAIDRLLYIGVQILNTHRQPIETDLAQQRDGGRRQPPRVDLDPVLALLVRRERESRA